MDNNTECLDLSKVKKIKKEKIQHQCLACGRCISDRRNLIRHLRKVHSVEPIVRKPQLRCSFGENCTFMCATSELLRLHLQKVHEFKVVEKVLNFKSKADFDKWKQEEEANTNARYVAYTGTKFRGTRRIYYLRCHRSGLVQNENGTRLRKRSKPSKGYTKCGTTCPSSIRVEETNNGAVEVMYYPVHLGHSLDEESILYMKLNAKEKEQIAGKLAQGEPVCKIVSDARKTRGTKLSRMNVLERRDVYNIKKNLKYLEKEPDHDRKEVDAWVRGLKLKGSLSNPIALYNPVDYIHDYCLVLIHCVQKIIFSLAFDGSIVYVKTKKGKPNVDLNVTAMSVICENGDAYPIAFCISHKTEYITLYTFFKIIHETFGTIKAQIFVSDNMSHYYLAWKSVMGECDNKLICTFDIESYWEQKLTGLKCPVGTQKTVSKQLKLLLDQTDKDRFEADLSKILKSWEENKDLKLFANFFQKFYVKKRFEWATCYRIHSTRKESINRYLEPINSVLDSIYEESYSSVRNALNLLLFFVRDVCLVKLLRWDEQAAQEKLRDVARIHKESSRLRRVRCASGSEWVISEGDSEFLVRKTDSKCWKKCGIFCESCDICTHDYSCMCAEYVTGFNICRHLHGIGVLKQEVKGRDTEDADIFSLKNSAVSVRDR